MLSFGFFFGPSPSCRPFSFEVEAVSEIEIRQI